MNMMTSVIPTPPATPIAILRALPPGPMAAEYQRLKRLADLFAAFEREDMEVGVDLLLAEMDARDGNPDEEAGDFDGYIAEDGFAESFIHDGNPGCAIGDPGEADGDELDGNVSEDDFMDHSANWMGGAGCPIADAPEATLGVPEEVSGRWGGNLVTGDMEDTELEDDDVPARRPFLRQRRLSLRWAS